MASALTPREKEIVRLASLGCTVHESAKILKVAPSTVDNHKARAMAKLGTDKAALLTRLALKLKVSSMNDKLTQPKRRRAVEKTTAGIENCRLDRRLASFLQQDRTPFGRLQRWYDSDTLRMAGQPRVRADTPGFTASSFGNKGSR